MTPDERVGAGSAARWHAWETIKSIVKWPFYRLYENRLEAHLGEYQLPQHIGMIMDGNRRFARGLGSQHVSVGHQRGRRNSGRF